MTLLSFSGRDLARRLFPRVWEHAESQYTGLCISAPLASILVTLGSRLISLEPVFKAIIKLASYKAAVWTIRLAKGKVLYTLENPPESTHRVQTVHKHPPSESSVVLL